MDDVVIAGAGEAGGRAAIELRRAGYDGALTLIGEETHAPYERPPLSKALLGIGAALAPTTIGDGARLAELGVERIAGTPVTEIDRGARAITLGDGRRLRYEALVLATGARARALPLPGAELGLTLRTYDEALHLRERLGAARRVIVVGGGFIGLELAAAARLRGLDVTVLEADTRLLRRSTPESLAAALEARHVAEGVEIVKGARIAGFEPAPGGGVVVHEAGGAREADIVILGVGAAPRAELAAAAGLAVDNGIVVDAQLRTADPAIYAIGDCANFPHPLFEGRRMRLESWRNAFDQGAHVARAILGGQEPFAALPWFWSDQYDWTLQIAGAPEAGVATVARDIGADAQILFHLDAAGRLVAAGALGPLERTGRDIKLAERLIARRATPPPAALADPGLSLKKLL